jgi:two-component system, LytTR family, response regulator
MPLILLIEDEPGVRLPIVDLLTANGFEVMEAGNGREGVELARENLPDLIVSDIMMPEMDGYAVLAALQDDPATAVIPFIFLSAKSDPADLRSGLGLGADDYLSKPFEAKQLLDAVRTRLSRFQRISESAAHSVQQNPEFDQIFIKDGDSCWFVEHERLRLLESEDNYVRFYFDNHKPLISRTLNSLEERLPPRMFFRANRKQIVNLKWIQNIQPWFNGGLLVTLRDGTKVQMSRRAAQTFRDKMGI